MTSANEQNVVVDVNVHFSAWRSTGLDSPFKEVVVRGIRKHFVLAISLALMAELYEQMTDTLKIPEDLALRYITLVRKAGHLFEDVENEIIWCTDPKDAYLFVLAHHCGACIVSYDKLFFNPLRRLTNIQFDCRKPIEFLEALRAKRGEAFGARSGFGIGMTEFTERDAPQSEPRPAADPAGLTE